MSKKIVFSTQTVDLITAELYDIKINHKDENISGIDLSISTDYDTYMSIKKNGYFHLTFDIIPEKTEFDPDREIRIILKADALLVRTLGELKDDNMINEIIASNDDAGEIVRKDINWYVLKVEQEVWLNDDMKEIGSVFEGFETAYGIQEDDNWEDEDITDKVNSLIDEFQDIQDILYKYDIPYKRNKNEFSGVIDYKGHKWTYFIYEADRAFVMYSAYTFSVSENNYDKLCRKIVNINSELTVGNFDLDMEEGIVGFRTYLDIGDDILVPELFERMLIGNIATTGKYYTEIYDAAK